MISLRPLNTTTWAKVTFFKNCHHDLCPYYYGNGRNRGLRYTGFEGDTDEEQAELNKIRKALEKKLSTNLANDSIYWDTFFIRIKDDELILNTKDNAYDELKYYFLLKHKDVKLFSEEKKPGAKYILYDEEREANTKNIKTELKTKAYIALDQMSADDCRDALRLYGIRSDDFSSSVSKQKISEYVEQDPGKFLQLWVENKKRKTQVLIEKCVGKGVIRRNNLLYTYGTTSLGKTIEQAIAFIEDPENEEILIGLTNAIKP